MRRHSQSIIALHWAILALLAIAFGALALRAALPPGTPFRAELRPIHVAAGQVVLLLTLARIALRFLQPPPGPLEQPAWSRALAIVVHAVLYVALFAQPVTGILLTQSGGKSVHFAGWMLPQLVLEDKTLHFALKEAHQWIGYAFLGLIALHGLAALFHHYVMRDECLRNMRLHPRWPAWRPRRHWHSPLSHPHPAGSPAPSPTAPHGARAERSLH